MGTMDVRESDMPCRTHDCMLPVSEVPGSMGVLPECLFALVASLQA